MNTGAAVQEIISRHPATGEEIARYPIMTATQVAECIEKARNTSKQWRNSSFSIRKAVLHRVADAIVTRQEALAKRISEETGKPLHEALEGDLLPAVSLLRYYARSGPKILNPRPLPLDKTFLMGRIHMERRVPRGVVGIISPWNFPVAIPIGGMAAALMGGNAVILKPSEVTPGTGSDLVDLFRQALQAEAPGLQDVVQLLLGDGSTGQYLTEGEIDYLIFTGSNATGRKVQAAMQLRGKEVSLELGGSDPMIVLPGADLDAAASYALWGRLTNSGQACAAVKRLFVPRAELETMAALLKTKASQLKQGPPSDPEVHIGPLVNESQLGIVDAQVQDALEKGTRCDLGGAVNRQAGGYYFAPTLLIDPPLDARVIQEEVFGPVLPVIPYDELEAAIIQANATPYGLGASVFGDAEQARQVAEQLEAGMVAINDLPLCAFANTRLSWSGRKGSGPGVSHGPRALLDTTHLQTISRNYLYDIPLFRKSFWHFGVRPDAAFSKVLFNTFSSRGLLKKLNPALVFALWRNRSSKKL